MKIQLTLTLVLLFASPAVAAPEARPDLYPNAHLKQVGQKQAQVDIDACRRESLVHEADSDRPGALRETTRGAVRGAARGALAGAIVGDKAGRGAGAGAALGGLGAAGNAARERREGSPEYRKYVEACLEDRGYKVVGWK